MICYQIHYHDQGYIFFVTQRTFFFVFVVVANLHPTIFFIDRVERRKGGREREKTSMGETHQLVSSLTYDLHPSRCPLTKN